MTSNVTEIVHHGKPTIRTRLIVRRLERHLSAWWASYNAGAYPNRPPERIEFDHAARRVVVTGAPSLNLGG